MLPTKQTFQAKLSPAKKSMKSNIFDDKPHTLDKNKASDSSPLP